MDYLKTARLIHLYNNSNKAVTIAHSIDVARSLFSKLRGRMFTQSIDRNYALLFPFSVSGITSMHMMFVPYDLGIVWVENGTVTNVEIASSWVGKATGAGNLVIEMHPDVARDISIGDTLYLEGEHNISQLQKPDDAPSEVWYK